MATFTIYTDTNSLVFSHGNYFSIFERSGNVDEKGVAHKPELKTLLNLVVHSLLSWSMKPVEKSNNPLFSKQAKIYTDFLDILFPACEFFSTKVWLKTEFNFNLFLQFLNKSLQE